MGSHRVLQYLEGLGEQLQGPDELLQRPLHAARRSPQQLGEDRQAQSHENRPDTSDLEEQLVTEVPYFIADTLWSYFRLVLFTVETVLTKRSCNAAQQSYDLAVKVVHPSCFQKSDGTTNNVLL
jgi:hypothetical protein